MLWSLDRMNKTMNGASVMGLLMSPLEMEPKIQSKGSTGGFSFVRDVWPEEDVSNNNQKLAATDKLSIYPQLNTERLFVTGCPAGLWSSMGVSDDDKLKSLVSKFDQIASLWTNSSAAGHQVYPNAEPETRNSSIWSFDSPSGSSPSSPASSSAKDSLTQEVTGGQAPNQMGLNLMPPDLKCQSLWDNDLQKWNPDLNLSHESVVLNPYNWLHANHVASSSGVLVSSSPIRKVSLGNHDEKSRFTRPKVSGLELQPPPSISLSSADGAQGLPSWLQGRYACYKENSENLFTSSKTHFQPIPNDYYERRPDGIVDPSLVGFVPCGPKCPNHLRIRDGSLKQSPEEDQQQTDHLRRPQSACSKELMEYMSPSDLIDLDHNDSPEDDVNDVHEGSALCHSVPSKPAATDDEPPLIDLTDPAPESSFSETNDFDAINSILNDVLIKSRKLEQDTQEEKKCSTKKDVMDGPESRCIRRHLDNLMIPHEVMMTHGLISKDIIEEVLYNSRFESRILPEIKIPSDDVSLASFRNTTVDNSSNGGLMHSGGSEWFSPNSGYESSTGTATHNPNPNGYVDGDDESSTLDCDESTSSGYFRGYFVNDLEKSWTQEESAAASADLPITTSLLTSFKYPERTGQYSYLRVVNG